MSQEAGAAALIYCYMQQHCKNTAGSNVNVDKGHNFAVAEEFFFAVVKTYVKMGCIIAFLQRGEEDCFVDQGSREKSVFGCALDIYERVFDADSGNGISIS